MASDMYLLVYQNLACFWLAQLAKLDKLIAFKWRMNDTKAIKPNNMQGIAMPIPYNGVHFGREYRPPVIFSGPIEETSADDPSTISSLEYSERDGTTCASGSYSRPKCTLL